MGSLPADYRPYSRYFVVPAITQDGVEVTPARVMLLTTRETYVTTQSSTTNEGPCAQVGGNVNGGWGSYLEADLVSNFPFVAPFSTR